MPRRTRKKIEQIPADLPASVPLLSPTELGDQARRAAEEILVASQAENTLRSYRSAMRYWCAWAQARYGKPFALPAPLPLVLQFVVDHLARGAPDRPVCELPPAIDQVLVDGGFKGSLGPLKMATVTHRIAVMSKLHQLRHLANPCEDPQLRHLLSRAKRAASKRGETVSKKTAATKAPLEAMIATCDGSLQGLRDKAILLFGWSSGGRRRSEVASATLDQLTRHGPGDYSFRLSRSKTNQDGSEESPEKPVIGAAGAALEAWLQAAQITEGPIFRRLWISTVGPSLNGAAVAAIVRRRARLAGVEGDWAGHSLRSGFITEAGKQNIPLGDVMAMTDHRKVDTVLGYFKAGQLSKAKVGNLFDQTVPAQPTSIPTGGWATNSKASS
jgi:integrase